MGKINDIMISLQINDETIIKQSLELTDWHINSAQN